MVVSWETFQKAAREREDEIYHQLKDFGRKDQLVYTITYAIHKPDHIAR